jgi:hypothetical protein
MHRQCRLLERLRLWCHAHCGFRHGINNEGRKSVVPRLFEMEIHPLTLALSANQEQAMYR